jgi:hypothetical protein
LFFGDLAEASLSGVEPLMQKIQSEIRRVDASILAAVRQQVRAPVVSCFVLRNAAVRDSSTVLLGICLLLLITVLYILYNGMLLSLHRATREPRPRKNLLLPQMLSRSYFPHSVQLALYSQ